MGLLRRIFDEYKYYTVKNWPVKDVGFFWDCVTDYDDINENTYTYFRRFIDSFKINTIPNESYILEVTPRTGNGTVYYHKKGKIKKTIGADVSQFQSEIYKRNMENNGIDFESVILNDYIFPFPDNEFDAVLSFETVEHMGKPDIFISEISRVLKPKGELVLTCPNILWEPVHWLAAIFNLHHSEGPHNFLTRKQLYNLFDSAELIVEKEIATILIPGGPKFLINIGEFIENKFLSLTRIFGLRRIFRCRKTA